MRWQKVASPNSCARLPRLDPPPTMARRVRTARPGRRPSGRRGPRTTADVPRAVRPAHARTSNDQTAPGSRLREAAARLAGLVARAPTARGLPAALEAGVDILPYQLEPALAVVDGVRRLLIADEVGLGKTIQAALAIAELKRRRPVLRAMVIVPRSLRDQWRDELNERFGLEVSDRGPRRA